MFEEMEVFDEAFLNNHIMIMEKGSHCYYGFDFPEDAVIEPQDKYTKSLSADIYFMEEDGEEIFKIGEMNFCVHLLSDFADEWDEPITFLVDDIDMDHGLCAEVLSSDGEFNLDKYDVSAYLRCICLKPEFRNKNIENYIVSHMDSIVWFVMRRKLDVLFGISEAEEEAWALPSADCYFTSETSLPVWVKEF